MATDQKATRNGIELSIVMPCLNEEKTVGNCVAQARSLLKSSKVKGEVIVADNGSTNQSVKATKKNGARVVHIVNKGYNSVLMRGFEATLQ